MTCCHSDQDELEERMDKLNKVTLKVISSSLGLSKAEQLQKVCISPPLYMEAHFYVCTRRSLCDGVHNLALSFISIINICCTPYIIYRSWSAGCS